MPLIYGEGEQAFARLQLEIMKSSTDHSLFVWTATNISERAHAGAQRGVLATSPDEFRNLGGILRSVSTLDTSAYEMTNLGLRITLPCSTIKDSTRELFAHLNCKADGFDDRLVGIWLNEVSGEDGQYLGRFFRSQLNTVYQDPVSWTRKPKSTLLYIIQPSFLIPSRPTISLTPHICSFDYSNLFKAGYLLEAYSIGSGSDFSRVRHQNESRIIFMLGDRWWAPWPWIIFFKYRDRAARVWVALSTFERKLWAVVDGSINEKDTPEFIQKDHSLEWANERWERGEIVEHALTNTVFEDEMGKLMVRLTVKRAIIWDQVGFMMKMAVLDNEQKYFLAQRSEKRVLGLRELLSVSKFAADGSLGAIEKVSSIGIMPMPARGL